jgi:hypothetical protein
VTFNDLPFNKDLKRTTTTGAEIARIARQQYEQEGAPADHLRHCDAEGQDGTALPQCLKIYLPEPAGRFGMVFKAVEVERRLRLDFVAFGVRHHPRGSNAPTVYQLAHRRLHG